MGDASVGLAPPNKAPSPPKLKHETLESFCQFLVSSHPVTNAKPPIIKNFLAMVLGSNGSMTGSTRA